MKIEKIELGKHCFGEYARINDKNIIDTIDKDGMEDSKVNEEIYSAIIKELDSIKEELDNYDWNTLVQIIVNRSRKFSMTVDENSSCGQCGDWSYRNVYELVNNDHDVAQK